VRAVLRSALCGLILAICWVTTTLSQDDIVALQRRYQELTTADNAALAEAQKLQVAVGERFGTEHEHYAGALISQANALILLNQKMRRREADHNYLI
jgi:hypothetical protein